MLTLENFPFLASPSYAYLINYQLQANLYNFLDEATNETQCLRLPGIAFLSFSTVVTLVAKIASIVEVVLRGLCILLYAPFTTGITANVKCGLNEIFLHSAKNFFRLTFMPVQFTAGVIYILLEPKSFTMDMAECMKVNLAHAKKGTLHTEEHIEDLRSVDGIVNPKFMDYQRKTWDRLHKNPNI